jgi:hypothetical protein
MDAAAALSGIPKGLRSELIDALAQISRNFREGRWEPSELNGGKLCEVVYTILKGHVDGKMPAKATKPRNMVDACRDLELADSAKFPRSVRIQIPRMLVALYEIRNNRGVGHVGGDVSPNGMDAKVVLESAKWIVAELVRMFHALPTDEAVRVVESLVERTLPVVWVVGNRKRVLKPDLSMRDQTLLLLYSVTGAVSEAELFSWVEHSNAANYRRDVLRRAHGDRLIEYDQKTGSVDLSPIGVDYVERNLPLDL